MASSGHFRWLKHDWREQSRHLESKDRHTFVEIFEKDGEVELESAAKAGTELLELLMRTQGKRQDSDWSLRLLLTSVEAGHKRNTLPYSLKTIMALQENWHMGDVCFYNQGQDLGACAMTFNPVACDLSAKGVYIVVPNLNFCECAVVHDSKTRSTWAVISNLLPGTVEAMTDYLRHAKNIAHMPFLVPLLLVNIASGGLWEREYEAYGHFNTIRGAMKCDNYERGGASNEEVNLTDMPRMLTTSADNVATIVSFATNLSRILFFLDASFDDLHDKAPAADFAEVKDHLHWLEQLVEDVRIKNETVKAAGHALVQMVYAVLQQRDNEISHRYGSDMRVIAIVTMMFLPSTFISTWFSASFYNFNPREDGAIASPWVILHFTLSILMTSTLLIAWRTGFLGGQDQQHTSSQKNRKTMRQTNVNDLKPHFGHSLDEFEICPKRWDSVMRRIPTGQKQTDSVISSVEEVC